MTPTQRTKKAFEDEGWTVAIVERWNPHVRIRQDLFGFADLLCMRPGDLPKLVQVTSTGWASRVAKVLASDLALKALHSGFTIEVHGWRKLVKKRGGKMKVWTPKIIPIYKEMFVCPFEQCDTQPN